MMTPNREPETPLEPLTENERMISGRQSNAYAWLIWALAASFFFAEYFTRVATGVMVPQLMQTFHVSAFRMGALSAFFYWSYVGMQLPVGLLVDRFGPRRLLTFAACLCGGAALIFSTAQHLYLVDLARLLIGFTAAFAFVGALKLASSWFPHSRIGILTGATQAIGMLGAAIGEGPVSFLVSHFGWRTTMAMMGGSLLVIAVLIGLIVRDSPKHAKPLLDPSLSNADTSNTDTPNATTANTETSQLAPAFSQCFKSTLQGLITIMRNPETWKNGVVIGFLYAPTAAFAELWGSSYIHQVYGLSPDMAASAVGMVFVGWAIMGPIAGWLSDRLQRRKPIMLTSIVASLILMSLVLYVPGLSTPTLFILLCLYGMANIGVATGYAVACEIATPRTAGTSMSFANMASVIIGACFQPIIGYILDLHWQGTLVHGARVFSAHDYRAAMMILPALFIVSLITCFSLKESYQMQQPEEIEPKQLNNKSYTAITES